MDPEAAAAHLCCPDGMVGVLQLGLHCSPPLAFLRAISEVEPCPSRGLPPSTNVMGEAAMVRGALITSGWS